MVSMAAAAREKEPTKGFGQAQKLKCGIKKMREMGGTLAAGIAKAGREYAQAVPNGWSWILSAKMVSGSGSGDVMTARWI